MGQVNVNPPPEQRDPAPPAEGGYGAGMILGVIVAIIVIVLLVWLLLFRGDGTTTPANGDPAPGNGEPGNGDESPPPGGWRVIDIA